MNPSISPSLSFLCSSVVQSATSWNFSTTPNHFHALEMATFAFKPQYPTSQLLRAPRAQQPAANLPRNKPASSTSSSTSSRAVHHSARHDQQQRQQPMMMGATGPEFEGTGTVYGRSDKANDDENDDDRDLPTIEELLLTKLQEQGFTTEDRGPDKTDRVEGVA